MDAGAELGIHSTFPYASNLYYQTAEYQAEIPKFVFYADVFPRLRVYTDYIAGTDTYPNRNSTVNHEWALALKAHNPNVYIMYGTSCNSTFKPRYYADAITYILAEAQWAQDNGIDEYCIGNEHLILGVHGTTLGQSVASITRASNVATAVFHETHGLTTGDYIMVSQCSDSSFNVTDSESAETVQCTVVNSTTITYPSTGSDGDAGLFRSISAFADGTGGYTTVTSASHGFSNGNVVFIDNTTNYDGRYSISSVATDTFKIVKTYVANDATGAATRVNIDWSAKEVTRKTIAIAPSVQAVFTRGPILYSEAQGHTAPIISAGITPNTNLDLVGLNGYGSGNNEAAYLYWKTEIDAMFAAFGTNFIITEINVVQEAPDTRKVGNFMHSQDGFEEVATRELLRRYRYLLSLGITQIYLFGPWGNGINWFMGFNFFCNISPYGWNDSTKRQIVGNLMPIIDRLKGKRVSKTFFGNCTNN